ncbi:MAG: hypothetical protein LBB38_01555 [Puniceicoccales bacterium]|nr:hypothetical protein [Puniceicoccales bacterium]
MIRAFAPQLQLLSVFDGEDQREPLLAMFDLVVSLFSSLDEIGKFSNNDGGFLLGLFYRLKLAPKTCDGLSSNLANAVLALCIEPMLRS